MTPTRVPPVAAYAGSSLRSVLTVPIDSLGVAGAGLAAAVGYLFGSANATLMLVVALAMLMDLVVAALRAVVDPLEKFCTQQLYGGILGKLFRVLIIPTASLVDWTIIVSPLPLPAGYEEHFPATMMVMLALIAAEITSTLNRFRAGGVEPGLISVVMRHLDRLKVGEEPPRRRHYDLSAAAGEEERAEALGKPRPEEHLQ